MPRTVLWNPAPLNSALKAAFKQAAYQTAAAITATKPSSKIQVRGPFFSGNRATIRGGGLAKVFEGGAEPHDIFPKGAVTSRRSKSKGQTVFKVRAIRGQSTTALKFGNRFAAVVHHPGMAAQPFMKPQSGLFVARYRVAARRMVQATAVRRAA